MQDRSDIFLVQYGVIYSLFKLRLSAKVKLYRLSHRVILRLPNIPYHDSLSEVFIEPDMVKDAAKQESAKVVLSMLCRQFCVYEQRTCPIDQSKHVSTDSDLLRTSIVQI